MSRTEDYKYTSLEQRVKVPFANTIKAPEVYRQLPLPEPEQLATVTELPRADIIFPLETAQPAPIYPLEMFRQHKKNGGNR